MSSTQDLNFSAKSQAAQQQFIRAVNIRVKALGLSWMQLSRTTEIPRETLRSFRNGNEVMGNVVFRLHVWLSSTNPYKAPDQSC